MTRKRVTIKDIAAELGLSHPTVSRALAGHDAISKETKARVHDLARERGYVANSGAQSLRRGHANVVGLLLPDMTNEFYAAVAQRLADECGERNLQLLLSISSGDPDRELSLVKALLGARPSGVIASLCPEPHPETLPLLSKIFTIQFMQPAAGLDGPLVTVEESGGARQAIEHLFDLGHRDIAVVSPEPSTAIGRARLRGIRAALRACDIELPPEYIVLGRSSVEQGRSAVEDLLALTDRPTAIYFSTAPLSLGGIQALSRHGLELPRDISVIVAGGSPWYEAWPGGLTSITLPSFDLAHAAAERLFSQLDKKSEQTVHKTNLAFGLVRRGSTGVPGR